MKNVTDNLKNFFCFFLCMQFCAVVAYAQGGMKVKGTVVDEDGISVIGASVAIKGNTTVGTITDLDGNFQLTVPNEKAMLEVSFIGMKTQIVKANTKTTMRIVLIEDSRELEEVVVVGYGKQRKASLVGAISQADVKELRRSSGLSSLGQALTGNLPGVVTTTTTGMPGDEDPQIIVRAQSSWNNSDPLILVDGVERPMNTVDISSVESISVLKDASATAVYGVKGANGVILITTKRGKEGNAVVNLSFNTTAKVVSKLPEKYDSYDTFLIKNEVIERELGLVPEGWGNYKPMAIINKYRNPANQEEWDRYANVDWEDELFRKVAFSYNGSANISGGTKFVKYFASMDFSHEGDMFKTFRNVRGYQPRFAYDRTNVRANLDFNLTKTTKFTTNLFGSNGVRTLPWKSSTDSNGYWASLYRSAPDAMRPIYSDGTYGYYAPRPADVPNSASDLANAGLEKRTNTQITTDFILEQDLSMLLKGLSVKANFSMDNTFVEKERGIDDSSNSPQRKYIDPETGNVTYEQGEDFHETTNWKVQSGTVDNKSTYRKLYYSFQLNYNRVFGKHDLTGMGLFSRERYAKGDEFAHYREDWVFRFTYNYAMRYFAEINGAYNGSEKFSSDHRFDFFPSFSLGWNIMEEPFMGFAKRYVDMVKLRGSWGRVGDDNISGRWLYRDTWEVDGTAQMGSTPTSSPYTFYRIKTLGNPDVAWETVEKRNIGVDYSLFGGLLAGSLDFFKDKRYDILIDGDSRAVPSFFGTTPSVANLGKVESKGYELQFRLNKVLNNGMRFWGNFNVTHAVNKIIFADDPELTPDYQKKQGYSINQTLSYLDNGYIKSWDDLYGSPVRESNNSSKLPGDYNIIDFNGDGKINEDDKAPYGYSTSPQNTFSTTVGFEWKGFSLSVMFYGVNNVTRQVYFSNFHNSTNVAYVEGDFYNKTTGSGLPLPRWSTTQGEDARGTRYYYDGSYLRLKNAELSYTFTGDWVKKMRLGSLRLYLNGDNLLLWTKMPDDRESNFSGGSDDGSNGAYPTVRRFNLGINITL